MSHPYAYNLNRRLRWIENKRYITLLIGSFGEERGKTKSDHIESLQLELEWRGTVNKVAEYYVGGAIIVMGGWPSYRPDLRVATYQSLLDSYEREKVSGSISGCRSEIELPPFFILCYVSSFAPFSSRRTRSTNSSAAGPRDRPLGVTK